jgi:type II secretory pathway component PulJ
VTCRRAAFTLLEVLAVVLLTALVLGVALNFTVDLSRASTRATEGTRSFRRALAVLDHVARDLERTVLLQKADETDPLDHPWVFLAEVRGGGPGADHLRSAMSGRIFPKGYISFPAIPSPAPSNRDPAPGLPNFSRAAGAF